MSITPLEGEFTTPAAMIDAIKQHRAAQARREAEERHLAEQAAQEDPAVQAWIEAAQGEAYVALIAPTVPPPTA